jgi:hypothetical protein
MKKRDLLKHAAAIIEQYAEELRASHVVNGAWQGEGVRAVQDEWADLRFTARSLRMMAEKQ